MGGGVSQTKNEMIEDNSTNLDEEFEYKIKLLKEGVSFCDPRYIEYAIYLLKSQMELNKNKDNTVINK